MQPQPFLPGFEPPPLPPMNGRAGHGGDPLFFAVQPDSTAAQRLFALAVSLRQDHQLKGAPSPAERLHISLRGLYVPRHRVDAAAKRLIDAARLDMPAIDIALDRAMSFNSGSGDRPLVVTGIGEELLYLQARTDWAMSDVGFANGTIGRAFKPHITLLHDRHAVPETVIEPIAWTIREVVLQHSLWGLGQHRILARWRLRG